MYILIKARNRFKYERITDLCDLGEKLYGPGIKKWIVILLFLNQVGFLFAYMIFIGDQTD
jgi:amino acid permease